ncbi:MAG TPA: HAMP domain-containing sensor histidine kinase, partial [Gemmatimonadales bacterium]|nr:HAMP domain-containing sensor histidine kinase [Gemmatimonadales bacterium]
AQLSKDNRFRLAVQGDVASRPYLLDLAGQAMRLSGLDLLQVQDSSGRILSSGHFRNEFDRLEPQLPRLLESGPDSLVLLRARTPDSTLLALTRIDSIRIANRAFKISGGVKADPRLLRGPPRDSSLSVRLQYPGAATTTVPGSRIVRELRLPYIDLTTGPGATMDTARLLVTQSLDPLELLRKGITRWFLLALALTVLGAVLGAAWLSALVTRPLRDLAEKTTRIDLDRLDQSFATERSDEIGSLSRLLAAMMDRLRASSVRVREAERRAAIGDLARQVNHDIKNGLAPIRNVLRHLSQVLQQDPAALPEVFEARRSTLESSVEYLGTLARNYDRLAPGMERKACDVNAIVQQVVRNISHDGAGIRTQLAPQLPLALADALMVRRVLENLVGNALDSLSGKADGEVTVSTEQVSGVPGPERVRITVADTGVGMSESELNRAFDDFYTTKSGGTGLGLSIVRRLILDLDGTLRVDTQPGTGTRVVVELPPAPTNESRP